MNDLEMIEKMKAEYIEPFQPQPHYAVALCTFCDWRRHQEESVRTAELPDEVYTWFCQAVDILFDSEYRNKVQQNGPMTMEEEEAILDWATDYFRNYIEKATSADVKGWGDDMNQEFIKLDNEKVHELSRLFIQRKEYALAFCEFCRWRRDQQQEHKTMHFPSKVLEWLVKAVDTIIEMEHPMGVDEDTYEALCNKHYAYFLGIAKDCTGVDL